ncbi:class I SAM-dependent methyltransferase [Mycoplasma bradburyae]|uniref:Class I SAM-dependent methyltransferase n=1 Tax=Mycoplasma bradburyae TaxID=2963128 RepID=A0AAW6HNK5_9MOLU|nr:class I SAM-dependent methyltransferase [Mycoplasma bradburyae]MDC4163648.1 class I SAM-dependent methyltransferase [Mycoplasma bradburyae]MDC4182256.1 class I SAM-dependent methyltransferase [Mycoplasma bradburyae]MDC4182749.1 class I SAM-dependent methyltransferase [Mycoplasma bradburyae]MDC4183422.1 class I SAM-dependent methyltransferase [Mycoplasma bradburyae]MDC4184430.1 class I SAM-dependent methyltransferase [Mycoplasma bradburyae]
MTQKIKAIASLIDKAFLVADVGCDHGHLGIELIKNNKTEYVLNIDINLEPLKQAISNTKKIVGKERIINIVNDGLTNLNIQNPIDYCVIAGMGVTKINDIISNSSVELKTLILQPERNHIKLRYFLVKGGYEIVDERIVYENKHYYLIVKAIKTENEIYLTNTDYVLGPILKNQISPELIGYVEQQKSLIDKIPEQSRNKLQTISFTEYDNFLKAHAN